MAPDRPSSAPPDDQALLRRFHEAPEPRLRDELVRRYLPLADHVARRYAGRSEPFEDLQQVAALGLLKALDRFDPGRGYAFSTFAVPTIAGELRRHFRDKSWLVRPPRELQERALAVERATTNLLTQLGRSPTTAEVAARCGLDAEQVLEAREALVTRNVRSLSQPGAGDDEDGPGLAERLGAEDAGFAGAEASAVFDSLAHVLTERERLVLHLRFAEDLTQYQIADAIGVSQMQVSRIIRACIDRLRHAAAAGETQELIAS
jgi:RNA polymerase sigma-B factor